MKKQCELNKYSLNYKFDGYPTKHINEAIAYTEEYGTSRRSIRRKIRFSSVGVNSNDTSSSSCFESERKTSSLVSVGVVDIMIPRLGTLTAHGLGKQFFYKAIKGHQPCHIFEARARLEPLWIPEL